MKVVKIKLLVVIFLLLALALGACQNTPAARTTTPAAPATISAPATTTTPAPTGATPEAVPLATAPTVPAPEKTAAPSTTVTNLPPTTTTVIAADFTATMQNHFGFMPAQWDFAASREAGGAFDRPFFELFQWDMIEKMPGVFDFSATDRYVRQAQQNGLHILANIQPFAIWDQAKCHGPQPTGIPGKGGPQPTRGKPCDMDAYRNFVTRLVERYDGDSVDDMPGLTVPIKHWELMNEPEFQTEPIYFQGTPADYAEVLKVTYETVKQTDPDAFIVQGGMAGMMTGSAAWWQGVFDAGGGQYLDIMNMHSIGHGEHLNIPAFKQLLVKNGLQDKPVWVTEVQYQQARQTQSYTNADFAKILARSYIFALANGADKLFYVNIKLPPGYDPGIPFDERSALITSSGEKSALFYAHQTVARMLGKLAQGDTVQVIKEKVGDWHIEEGQYKFTIGGQTVYALWGSGPPPAEITGQVTVVDITGAEKTIDAASLRLADNPVFVLP
jgi:hypothetical protein